MGNMRRAGTSFMVVLVSVLGVIALSWLLTEINFATVISVETNSQIAGRISPRLIDLFTALAAGAAGAFAMSRDDVADSLPGVAIAISLVPPLCVAGIGLAEAEYTAAWGAMLLFTTNFLSILLAGGMVLAVLGLGRATTKQSGRGARQRPFVLIAIGIFIVAIPLAATTAGIFQQALIKRDTATWAEEWLAGTDYAISQVEVGGDQVDLFVYGSGPRPELNMLGDRVTAEYEQITNLRLLVVPSEEERIEYVPK